MKKILFISALSLLVYCCNAQTTFGVSVGYAPWGFERLKTDDFTDSSGYYHHWLYRWEGYHTFVKPVLKLGFEIRGGVFNHLFRFSYSTVDVEKIDTSKLSLGTFNIKQIGFSWNPGLIILPRKRVQIPLYLGFGANYYMGKEISNNLQFDFSLMAQLKIYLTYRVAIYGGYAAHWGIGKQVRGFRHYPEMGVLINLNKRQKNLEQEHEWSPSDKR